MKTILLRKVYFRQTGECVYTILEKVNSQKELKKIYGKGGTKISHSTILGSKSYTFENVITKRNVNSYILEMEKHNQIELIKEIKEFLG